MEIEKDELFSLAEKYVETTGVSLFLTGKAGTGKTTFLRYITRTTAKRFVVLAPTGVAAINAGGSTIHSFFQLPLCPYLPDVKELVTEYQMPDKFRSLRRERARIIRTLDLLIIDEISMVRADLLDAVDMMLRRYRRHDQPFGGVQLLMIGDAQQLSPVVAPGEKQYLAQVYDSPYFFSSKALRSLHYVTLELSKVYRQKDADFLEILNSIRENAVTPAVLAKLNSRVGGDLMADGAAGEGAADGSAGSASASAASAGRSSASASAASAGRSSAPASAAEPIRLVTHNVQANEYNLRKMNALPMEFVSFTADVEGEFPENSFPAEQLLSLKVEAQVMFVRNASDGSYYNGRIGRVSSIENGASDTSAECVRNLDNAIVTVEFDDGSSVVVEPVTWENVQYELDGESGDILPNVVGTFRQLPLRAAWAITIHKSQGLTFDRVVIDAGAAFAFGQVYVALSRCRSLEGVSLETPVRPSVIYSDQAVSAFNAQMPQLEGVRAELQPAALRYLYDQLRDIFDFGDLLSLLRLLNKAWAPSLQKLYPSVTSDLREALLKLGDAEQVAAKFRRQLSQLERAECAEGTGISVAAGTSASAASSSTCASSAMESSSLSEATQQRLSKASEYFLPLMEALRRTCVLAFTSEIDAQTTKKLVKEASGDALTQLEIRCKAMEAILGGGFRLDEYSRIRTKCLLDDHKGVSRKRRVRKGELERMAGGVHGGAAGQGSAAHGGVHAGAAGQSGVPVHGASGQGGASADGSLNMTGAEALEVNEELRERLMEWRSAQFKKDNVPAYKIMHQSTLMEIATLVPTSPLELLKVNGFGEKSFQKYGDAVLAICREFKA